MPDFLKNYLHKTKSILGFHLLILAPICLLSISCKPKNSVWEATFNGITSSSSIQCVDLTNDGVLDLVVGAGGEEWERTDAGILCINGKDGQLIWKAKARNQIVGSAVFLDINNDKISDVIIGGRSAELQALDGKTGALIWEFYKTKNKLSSHDDGWYNFFNPQIVLDQNNDGIKDFIICNGGDALIPAGSIGRPAGNLLLISGKSGQILAQDKMPDGQETYSTPVCFDCETNQNPTFIFGSGGETEGGHLYLANLNMLKNKELKQAKILSDSPKKGFIAPPILADFNKDKSLDILVNQADGTTKLINGKTHQVIWEVKCDSSEVYSQPAIGYFHGNDTVPDVFVSFVKGVYPSYSQTINYLINGKNGAVASKFISKRFTYSSPLVADLNEDGIDEVILNTILDFEEQGKQKPYYQLTKYDFAIKSETIFGKKQYGACFASTPWMGDLDNDGKLDLLYSGSPATVSEFPGTTTFVKPIKSLQIHHIEFQEYNSKNVKWGNYLGKNSFSKIN
jgi:outer membrane protein assembly factor BamB